MALIVEKFGGSSLADLQKLRNAAEIIASAYKKENQVVVVVSAQGDTTDYLVEKAAEIGPNVSEREMDVLLSTGEQISMALVAMTLMGMGIPAVSLCGWQAGIRTAVVSNKFDSAVKGLCHAYFGTRIPVAIGESQGVARKPAPDTVFRALEELGAGTGRAVYVGDSDVDIQTAANAGLPCLSVSWGFRDAEFLTAHGAQRIVDTPQALEALLLGA